MRISIKLAAAAGALLAAVLAAGCAAQPASPPAASVQRCAAYGAQAIRHHTKVTSVPPPCQGLSKADVNEAVARAIHQVAGGRRKAVSRRLAARAGGVLGDLVTAPRPDLTPFPPSIARGSPARRPGMDVTVALAALASWLVAAASGGYLLAGWISHGGLRRRQRRGGYRALPPAVVLSHFGLAVAGLAIWIAYLAADRLYLAWIAVGLLLPVAGLGMATLAIGLPGMGDRSGAGTAPGPARTEGGAADSAQMAAAPAEVARPGPARTNSAGTDNGTEDMNAAGSGTSARGGGVSTKTPSAEGRPARRGAPVLMITIHGAAATAAILFALLAAVGGG
jgi:hypothetical protein